MILDKPTSFLDPPEWVHDVQEEEIETDLSLTGYSMDNFDLFSGFMCNFVFTNFIALLKFTNIKI